MRILHLKYTLSPGNRFWGPEPTRARARGGGGGWGGGHVADESHARSLVRQELSRRVGQLADFAVVAHDLRQPLQRAHVRCEAHVHLRWPMGAAQSERNMCGGCETATQCSYLQGCDPGHVSPDADLLDAEPRIGGAVPGRWQHCHHAPPRSVLHGYS
jgi:hypothetical protein